jgi:hypothetical protein
LFLKNTSYILSNFLKISSWAMLLDLMRNKQKESFIISLALPTHRPVRRSLGVGVSPQDEVGSDLAHIFSRGYFK